MSLYNSKSWKEFRDNVIESDGYQCTYCQRGKDEVILQVHHLKYISGKRPWEYGTDQCITLCKGCHAAEHGIIRPKIGWEYIDNEDLEDLVGTCENCGTSIRYVYHIGHKNWGFMQVGTMCCDNLTDTQIASNKRETLNRYRSRKNRFIKSKRWKLVNNALVIKQSLFEVKIVETEKGKFSLSIHSKMGRKKYDSEEEAKSTAFEVIESGELIDFFDKYKIEYRKK